MTTILIVEADDAIRNTLVQLLKLEGFDTLSASDGDLGLARAKVFKPDLIISDVSTPIVNGWKLLADVRADETLACLPFILLTAQHDHQSMRRGMADGADGCLSKPFTRTELLAAVNAQVRKLGLVKKAIPLRLASSEAHKHAAASRRVDCALPQSFAASMPEDTITEELRGATVLFSDIHDFTALAEKLSSSEAAELLAKYFEAVCPPILKNGGEHLKFAGSGLVAIFTDTANDAHLPSTRRAISAALTMVLAVHEFRGWLAQRFPASGLPPFATGVGLHRGEVTLSRLSTLQSMQTIPIGDTVSLAARLESATRELGWTLATSSAALAKAGDGVQTGRRTSLTVPGKAQPVDVLEITGLVTSLEDRAHGMAELTARTLEITAALNMNTEITARAVKNTLDSKQLFRKAQGFEPAAVMVRLKGYRITEEISTGGRTEVYLAKREIDDLNVVLKTLDTRGDDASEHLAQFIQEYTLLSKITHPHVIRVYEQGFTNNHAYIAMEYFERGDLRKLFGPEMTQKRVLGVIRQTAGALDAIHKKGLVHRDIKPENIVQRVDGSVALADFGISISTMSATSMQHAQVAVGTPYYASPEQAGGKASTPQSDLYSLGVMMFEMLAGKRPFIAESLESLLAMHLYAETPALPPAHADLQSVVNKLMHKNLALRYASAQDLLTDIDQLQ